MVLQFIRRKEFLLHKTYSDSYLCFWLVLLHSVSYIFFLNQLPSSLSTVFNANSSDIDYVLSINPSANVLFFRDFNIHHNNWLTYSSNNWLTGCPISLDSLWLLLCWLGQSSWPFERYHVPWKDILKISAPVAASESCEWVQFGIDVYIPHPK